MSPQPSLVSIAPSDAATSKNAADRIAETLKAYGVRFAFGIPGNDVLELVRACEEQGIEFVLAKNEPAAAFMADAVYQLTGVPAVLIAALGPGLSNAMSGIAGAAQERSAVIVLAGNIATGLTGIYNHQVFDHIEMARPVVKLAARLNPSRVQQQMSRALDVAMAHPAGPVLLDCHVDETRKIVSEPAAALQPAQTLRVGLAPEDLAVAQRAIARARRPLLLIGRGALHREVVAPIRNFVEMLEIPFLTTYKAKGIVSENSAQCLGSLGLSPVVDAEVIKLIEGSDLLVLAGFDPIELRDAWLDAWPHDKAVLSLDWSAQSHRIFPVGIQAVGHLPTLLGQLTRRPDAAFWPAERAVLEDYVTKLRHIVRPREPAGAISPAALFAEVSRQLREDWILTVDVGAHRILANHAIACRSPGQMLQSNGLGCMGYALPAAIAAQLVETEKPVVVLVGDGCLLMTLGELAVARERNLPIVIVVLNDSTLGLIKLKQSKMQMTARGVDFAAQRFDQIAAGFGVKGVRVSSPAQFAAALKDAVAARQLTVIDAVIDPSEYWEQM